MGRPYGLLRAGYPFLKTLGMRRITNYPNDVAIGDEGRVYILCRSEGQAEIRVWSFDDAERLTDELIGIGGYGSDEGKFTWPVNIILDSEENIYVSDEALHRNNRLRQGRRIHRMLGRGRKRRWPDLRASRDRIRRG